MNHTALTDPLRAHRHRGLYCDGCSGPLPADSAVWRVGRPDGSAVHAYLCAACDDRWLTDASSRHRRVVEGGAAPL